MQQLFHDFFAAYLQKINNLRPYHKAGPRAEDWKPLINRWDAGGTVPQPCRYEILESKDISWVEEQRVLRALWRIVVNLSLQDKYQGSASPISWGPVPGLHWLWSLDEIGEYGVPCWALDESENLWNYLLCLSQPQPNRHHRTYTPSRNRPSAASRHRKHDLQMVPPHAT